MKAVKRALLLSGAILTAASPHAMVAAEETLEGLLNSSYLLYKEGDFDAALDLIDEGIHRYPDDRISFLNLTYMILDKTDDVDRLIEVAIERAAYFEDSPKKSREVVLGYLKNNDSDNALEWLKITLERGYQDHADLVRNSAYDPLRDTAAFSSAIRTVEERVGIDQKAKGFSGQTLDGSPLTLEEQHGRVVLIDFWALYCGPCRQEIDLMLDYYPEFRGDGFEIVAINLDESRTEVTDFVEEKKLPWPVIYSGKGWDDDIRTDYGLANIPSYWLVDRQGTLRHVGLQGEALEEAIRALLKE